MYVSNPIKEIIIVFCSPSKLLISKRTLNQEILLKRTLYLQKNIAKSEKQAFLIKSLGIVLSQLN